MVPLPVDPLVLGLLALAVVVSLFALGYGVAELRLAVLVLRSRPSSVLETPGGGPVELRGTAEPAAGVLRSPFTETPCLAYEYAVEEERDSKNGRHWATIASGDEYVPFRLDDGSGSVSIEPPGADFRLATDARIEVDGGTEPPAPIARFIDRTEAVDSENTSIDLRVFELRTGRDRRFVERRLEPGETVHVLGTARYDPSASRAAGGRQRRRRDRRARAVRESLAPTPPPAVRPPVRDLGQFGAVARASGRRTRNRVDPGRGRRARIRRRRRGVTDRAAPPRHRTTAVPRAFSYRRSNQ